MLISFGSNSRIKAQNAEQTMALADELFALQQYESALKYYHRVAFFGGDSLQVRVFPRLAECYFQEGDYQNSIFYWNLSANTVVNDSLRTEYLFRVCFAFICLSNMIMRYKTCMLFMRVMMLFLTGVFIFTTP